jgi:hypothetical protein
MTMRSKGSSKIIGAAIAATTALDSRTPRPHVGGWGAEVARHHPYESGSETPNAIKIAMRAKQAPVSRSVFILGMKSMK